MRFKLCLHVSYFWQGLIRPSSPYIWSSCWGWCWVLVINNQIILLWGPRWGGRSTQCSLRPFRRWTTLGLGPPAKCSPPPGWLRLFWWCGHNFFRWSGRPSAVRGHLGDGLVAAATSTGWLHVWKREGLRWAHSGGKSSEGKNSGDNVRCSLWSGDYITFTFQKWLYEFLLSSVIPRLCFLLDRAANV